MDYQALFDELNNDPLGRGYAGMTDRQAADDLNTAYRQANRASMSGDEIFQATVPAEFNALPDGSANNTADRRSHWLAFCGRQAVDPFATANIQFVISIFGGASQTVANLQAARVTTISRATELGFGRVSRFDVETARARFGG